MTAGPGEPNAPGGDEEDLVREAYPTEGAAPPGAAIPPKTFLPWHRPRKHYVRVRQWCKWVGKLIQKLSLAPDRDPRPLKYLTMPGDELLDVRTLHGVLAKAQVPLQFLGINRAEGAVRLAESHLSESEVKKLQFVYPVASKIMLDSLQAVADVNSPAFREVKKYASYDVINIDLCDSALTASTSGKLTYLESFFRLFELQHRGRAQPWLFFLTTYANKDAVRDAWPKVGEVVRRNTEHHVEFRSAMQEHLGHDSHDVSSASVPAGQVGKLVCLGFSKWLLAILFAAGWSVRLVDSQCYTVGGAHNPNLYSLAFWVERLPTPLFDPTAITQVAGAPATAISPAIDERSLAIELVHGIAASADVDDLLSTNRGELEQVIRQASEILRQARHNVERYQQWIDAGCPSS